MTSTKGVIKGGSWDDVFEECTFDKNSKLSAPDSRVGFRIMMEVLPDIQDLPILTSKIASNLGVDKSEITYFNWLEFLQYQKLYYGEHSPEYRDNLPDTTLVKQGECENYNALSYTHQAFRDIPIIGITQKQAQNYSVWRSNQVFETFLLEKGYINHIEKSLKDDFTIEKYYNNAIINYSYNKNEKYPFYPCYSIPNIEEYKLINKLANEINNVKIKLKTIKMKIEIDTMSICDLTQFSTIINLENKNDIYFLESGIAEWTDDTGKVINGSIEISEDRKAGEVLDANQLKYIGFRNKVEWVKWNHNQTK